MYNSIIVNKPNYYDEYKYLNINNIVYTYC